MNVLVVEDSLPVRSRLIEFIRSMQGEHTIIATASVREALDLIHAAPPELIMLDLRLEDGDGTEVLALSKNRIAPPIVYVFSECGSREAECLALGADGFFDKGEDPAVLLATLEQHLDPASGGAADSESWRYSLERKHAAEKARATQSSIRDISGRKAAEAALEESEQRYSLQARLLDAVGQSVIATTLDGAITYWNQAATAMHGWEAAEVISRNVAEVTMADSARVTGEQIMQQVRDGRSWSGELILCRRDYTIFPAILTTAPIRGRDGNMIGIVAVATDITQQKNAEQALREATARFSAVVEVSPLPIIVVDDRNHVEIWNGAAERTFGWTSAEVLGCPNPLVPEDGQADSTAAHVAATLAGNPVIGVDMRKRRKDGTLLDLRLWTAALPASGTCRKSAVGMLADITEQKRLEEQFRQAQKMEAVGRLAGGVAHDFNNILLAIGGHVALCLEDASLQADVRADLEEVANGVDRAAALTRQLLAFSRMQVLQPRVLDLNSTLADLERMLRRVIGEDIDLITIPSPTLRNITADKGQMEQVLVNLVVNARDAMLEGGKITVTTSNVDGGDHSLVEQLGLPPGKYVRLIVSDNGCGMDSDTVRRIFEPFFTTKEQGQGTGLGLSTVYGIVKQSGGEIGVYSEVGIGTAFKIYLPGTDAMPESLQPSRPLATGRCSETILVSRTKRRSECFW